MDSYLYLSLLPEALIFSQLPPERFGKYMAIGDKKLTRGLALFFTVDPELDAPPLRIQEARKKCVAHTDGSPRRSTYVSVYGALANLPISSLGSLYLSTKDGRVLELQRKEYTAEARKGLYLYQEICPVVPKVASPLSPQAFAKYVTDPKHPVFLPRLFFCDLRLDGLATDPEKSSADNLPYNDINHLRECLTALRHKDDKMTKTVYRDIDRELLYYTADSGFFVGDQEDFAYYPMPCEEDLEGKYYAWWSSASTAVSRF